MKLTFKRVLKIVIALLGSSIVIGCTAGIFELFKVLNIADLNAILHPAITIAIYAVAGIIGFIVFFIIEPKIIRISMRFINRAEVFLTESPMQDVIAGIGGLIIGLIVAFLLTPLINMISISWLSWTVSIIVYIVLGYLGIRVSIKRFGELHIRFGRSREDGDERTESRRRADKAFRNIPPKILDTSVIIDGRIHEISQTGFLEGKLVVPEFVLQELRHIADSPDALRRQRGRRGLDILSAMQSDNQMITIYDKDYDGEEVDEKLISLAKELKGKIVTNDFNLNKVAKVKGVEVLNINQLANALKPAVLPGEEMQILIIRDGKEQGQGIGYLDDGTMIVVDGGKEHLGQVADVTVTSVLQTSAGRMVFAKLNNSQ